MASALWQWVKDFLGPASAMNVFIGGNDGSGKTTLLYAAQLGEIIQTTPTIGQHAEEMSPLDGGPRLLVQEFGGGGRSGDLQGTYVAGSSGLIFVLRDDDKRIWSALWELYWLVQRAVSASGNAEKLCVCVVVLVDPAPSDAGGTGTSTFAQLAKLAQRECLPPGGTECWSPAHRWAGVDGSSGGEQPSCDADTCIKASDGTPSRDTWADEQWLPAWDEDRQSVVRNGRTSSHGMRVLHAPGASPALATLHRGPWNVLPMRRGSVADAALPFKWIAAQIAAQDRM